ncbi:hypothetical protein JKF63_02916 [Porcisia hertigi]|uniref:Palmitoyltransferase n=1 Tax=Porcisia hertigi TaxID=2761500 RepID=A0A836I876_9TRYP|nr:hypothetical protein JKF63_02916 [Porcisia hertigi]
MSQSPAAQSSHYSPPEGGGTMRLPTTASERESTHATAQPPGTPKNSAPLPYHSLPSSAAVTQPDEWQPIVAVMKTCPQGAAASLSGSTHGSDAQEGQPAPSCHSEERTCSSLIQRQAIAHPPLGRCSRPPDLMNSAKRDLHRSPEARGVEDSSDAVVAHLECQPWNITVRGAAPRGRAAPMMSFSPTTACDTSTCLTKRYGGGAVLESPVEGAANELLNPLRREGRCSRGGSSSSSVVAPDDEPIPSLSTTEYAEESEGPSFSLSRIPPPRTAEEYEARVAEVAHVRCGLGQELEGDAKDVYGPTWPFSRRMFASTVFGTRECPAPNCDHKTNIQAVTGPCIWTLPIIYGALMAYPVFTTVAYVGEYAWQGIIGLWLLSGVTIVFVTLCAFTNPGVVPRRRLKNITESGDVLIVRVPAPNAKAVLDKLQELPDTMVTPSAAKGGDGGGENATAEALRSAVADGDVPASVFNHRRSALYSMLRYFETDTGRILPYNPRLSESELAVPTLEFPILFCRTCRVARGPRTHHCRVCNNCVDEMDHHCPWTNSCIGRNNYPYFFGSLFFLHVMVLYALLYNFALNIRFIYLHPTWSVSRLLRYSYGMPIIVYLSFFVLGLFFFPLLVCHVYMTCQGLTTTEMLKKKWKASQYFGGINPWSQKHWYQNFYSRLFRRWPAAQDDPLCWLDSRYYYGVTVAAAVEDQKIDWLISLPPDERRIVQERSALEWEVGAKGREKQEADIVWVALEKRGFRVA